MTVEKEIIIELLKDIMDIVEDSTIEVEVVMDLRVYDHGGFVVTKEKMKLIDADIFLKKLEIAMQGEHNG